MPRQKKPQTDNRVRIQFPIGTVAYEVIPVDGVAVTRQQINDLLADITLNIMEIIIPRCDELVCETQESDFSSVLRVVTFDVITVKIRLILRAPGLHRALNILLSDCLTEIETEFYDVLEEIRFGPVPVAR